MTESAADSRIPMPLFYKQPEPLDAVAHARLRIRTRPSYGFASSTSSIPISASEFVQAAGSYPIVFIGDPIIAVAVVGLKGTNVFVEPSGAWVSNTYVPAYVRRYPFVFIEEAGDERMVLGIDRAGDQLQEQASDATEPLFENGEPSATVKSAIGFCQALRGDQRLTSKIGAALREHKLLVAKDAHVEFPDGRTQHVRGFEIVDEQKFRELPETLVAEWHRNGWSALVHLHLASQQRWTDLLARHQRRDGLPGSAEPQRR